MEAKQCFICGRREDRRSGMDRKIDKDSHLYCDILRRDAKYCDIVNGRAGVDTAVDTYLCLCGICDRLVSEYEEVCNEKSSLQSEIEFRLANQLDEEDSDVVDDYPDHKEDVIEKGEISDVNKFLSQNVKIFEIDVKQEPVKRKETVVITKFEHKAKQPVLRTFDIEPETWARVFGDTVLSDDWILVAENMSSNLAPFCNVEFQLVHFRHDHDHQLEFRATGRCHSCQVKMNISAVEGLQLQAEIVGVIKCKEEVEKAPCQPTSEVSDNCVYQCSSCKKTFMSGARLKIHANTCDPSQLVTCSLCFKKFANKRNLKEHLAVIHNVDNNQEKTKHQCPICEKIFFKKFNLTSHMIRHSKTNAFHCNFADCGKGFKREKTLLKHCQVVHGGIREKFLCGQCGQEFNSQVGFKSHVAKHNGQEYVKRSAKCEVCGKLFRSGADLKIHFVTHTKEKPFLCSWTNCDQSFAQKASLKDHMNVHEEKFKCHGCDKSFGRERYLVMHVKACVNVKASQESQFSERSTVQQQGNVTEAKVQLVQTESGGLAMMLVAEEIQPQ